jgi:spermidine synthase/MFS family permease
LRTLLPFVAFFASGASSLIFQAIWTRMLHHVFGATSVAMSTVLSAFMAGLGLGAYWFGKRAARFRRPLVVYALCELGVAASAALLPELVRVDGFLANVNVWLRTSAGAGSFTFLLARFACVVPLLLVPTALMGGTLPLLAQHFVGHEASAGETGARVGRLYAVNTFGAVFGTLLGNFVLLPTVGVARTHLIAIGMNVALAVFVLVLFRQPPHRPDTAQPSSDHRPSADTQDALPRWVRRLAVATFGISGACALAYEVVWSRALSMAIGSSMQSFALILITFLVGIAGGSAFVSAELARVMGTSAPARTSLLPQALLAMVLCGAALLPAAVLSSALTAGITWLLAVLLTIFAAWAGFRRARAEHDLEPGGEASLRTWALTILALPCVVAIFECVRFATLRTKLPAVSVHGYLPFVAAAVVCVIAINAMLVTWLRRQLCALAAAIQLSIAVATLVGYVFQDEVPYVFARLVSALDDLPDHVGTVRFFMFLTAGLCTLPATLGMGAMFPLTMRLFTSGGSEVGRDVAVVYSANTVGSICGAWLPGFVLMPLLGMETTLHAGILLNVALALAMLFAAWKTRPLSSRTASTFQTTSEAPEGRDALADNDVLTVLEDETAQTAPRSNQLLFSLFACSIAVVVAVIAFAMPHGAPLRWDLSHMTLGAFRVSLARSVLDRQSWGAPDLLYYRDGISTTVSVERWGKHLSLKNNGKVDASNGVDMPTQIAVSAFPLLLHKKHGRDVEVAIVGFGSGVTVGAALEFPVKHVEAMELEKGVVEAAAAFFADVNHFEHTLADFPYVQAPRLSLYNDDGRNFLAATQKRYDVIISEPSNPWITGVSDLFTIEHFRVSKKKLKPGGVYCQWVQLYEMSPSNVKTIYRTFASQFAHVVAFSAEELSSDTILIGSDEPIELDIDALARAMQPERVKRELERAFVRSPYDMLARVLFAKKQEILQFAHIEERLHNGAFREELRAMGDAPCPAPTCRRRPATINTDDNMWIELRAPEDLIGFSRYAGYLRSFYGASFPYGRLLGRVKGLEGDARKAELADALLAHGRIDRAAEIVRTLAKRDMPRVASIARSVELLQAEVREPPLNLRPRISGPQLDPRLRRELDDVEKLIAKNVASGEYASALALLDSVDLGLRTASGSELRALYGYLNYKAAAGDRTRLEKAVAELEGAIRTGGEFARAHPELFFYLARAQRGLSSFQKAAVNMHAFVDRVPN